MIHSFIVPAENADLYDLVYSEILGCYWFGYEVLPLTWVVHQILHWIRTISGGTGCYLLGEKPYEESNKVLYLIGQPIIPVVVVAELTK
jgi:hypothetical protein